MGLYKEFIEENYQVYVWKIEEEQELLLSNICLGNRSKERFELMRSNTHKRGFLAVRQLLLHAGYLDSDLSYSSCGRPMLSDGKYISISHSFDYATIIIGEQIVGIDVEKKREKISVIAEKFCSQIELEACAHSAERIHLLTQIWCVKEAMFKMCESRSLSFKDHMSVSLNGTSVVVKDNFVRKFIYQQVDLDDFLLVYALITE